MSALERFEVLILVDNKTGEVRMDPRRGLRFVHEVLGTPIEFGLHFGGEPQTLAEIERSCDVCDGDRTLNQTHLATGMGAGRVEVPAGKSAIACARQYIDDTAPKLEQFVAAHMMLPGASALERGTALVCEQLADEAKRWAESDAKAAAYQRRNGVFEAIRKERRQQDKKWGEQNHPSIRPILANREPFDGDLVCADLGILSEDHAKAVCESHAKHGTITWAHIAIEELSEAVSCADDATRRRELVQLAAVVAAWIECIDRRSTKRSEGGAS